LDVVDSQPGHSSGPSDKGGRKSGRRWSKRFAITVCAVLSVVGWIAIAVLFSMLTPDQKGQVATDKDVKELQMAPATGPDGDSKKK
jgi:hypothetical protein